MARRFNVTIREETTADRNAVCDLNASAFSSDAEARLVDALRESADEYISLVAVKNQHIVGHIMFSPVTLEAFDGLRLMGLAPMAVSPFLQRAGIGSELVTEGLQRCTSLDIGAVAVLGHPEYYPRFGFRPSSRWGIKSEYNVPEDVFMLLELTSSYLHGYQGTIRYAPAFTKL